MSAPTRTVLFAVLGALSGLLAADDAGWLAALGAGLGALVGLRLRDADRIRQLETRIEALDRRPAAPSPPASAPATPEGIDVRPTPRPPARTVPGPAHRPTPRPSRPSISWADLPPGARRAWDFASGGNVIARVGLLVLFVGLGLLIRYAAAQGFFPIEARLAFAAAVGGGLLALGWRLRRTAEAFGLTLQGGGVAVLYLTVYAAYALYALVPSLAAIGLMALVAAGCAALAVVQAAPGLALLGVAGGFAAPVLAGTEAGNHVLLLGYYALLNLGVLGIAGAKGWRSVALVGFVSTFVTGGLWGGLAYRPALYASVQPFVAVNFAVYLALAVRFALRSVRAGAPPERALVVDGALVFGLPAATFVLQAALVEGVVPYGRAWSAAALAVVYLVGAALLTRQRGVRLLADAFLAIGLAFATLALPLAFQRVVFGTMWVLEGAALVWVGTRQAKGWMRAAGLGLQAVAAAVLFVAGVLSPDRAFSAETLTGWIVAVALGLSAYVLSRPRAAPDPEAPPRRWSAAARRADALAGRVFLAFALFWWVTTASVHVLDLVADPYEVAGLLLAAAGSGALFLGLGRVLRWRGLAAAALGTAATGWALWLLLLVDGAAPFADGRGLGWLALLGVLGGTLALEPSRSHGLRWWAFVGGAWLAVAVLAHGLGDAAAGLDGGWSRAAVGAVLAAGLAAALRLTPAVASVGERRATARGLAVAAAGWVVLAAGAAGGAAPLPTVPLLAPLDLASIAGLLSLTAFGRQSDGTDRGAAFAAVAGLGLVALTAAVLRGVHHLGGVAWAADALFASSAAQAALAVAWTVLALAIAVAAVRRQSRPLWFFGAGVLALVVAKLFVVDLAQAQALVRIGAFLTVGTLVILIGYRAPLPPRRPEGEPADGGPIEREPAEA